jgi:YegS/Rv2252/BmrU family lipid kinase
MDPTLVERLAIIASPSADTEAIRQAFKDSGKQLVILKVADNSQTIADQIRKHQTQLLVAAGGDGTVNAVANIAVSLDLPLAVLPLGTLNHFAKDAGLPLNLDEAAHVITTGTLKSIDYCTVNDKVFVNNSSIGIYPLSVEKREQLQPSLGKWLAAALASLLVSLKLSTTHLILCLEDKDYRFKTPLLFVGNNSYGFKQRGYANRVSLDDGQLFVYLVRANRITALLRLLVAGYFGKRQRKDDFIRHVSGSFVVKSRKSQLTVSLDGEVQNLRTPLTYRMHSKDLRIMAPKS